MHRRVSLTSLKDAKHAVTHVKTPANPSVKCMMLYALHAANPARFLSSPGKTVPYTAANASPKSRSKSNRHQSFWHRINTSEYSGVFSFIIGIAIIIKGNYNTISRQNLFPYRKKIQSNTYDNL